MLLFAVLALVLWIFGKELSVDATTAAVSIVALMVLCKVISWEDVIGNKGAWNVLVWFSTLVALAGGLGKVGILKWIGTMAESSLTGLSPMALMISMIIVFFILHYFFASVTAHVSALVPVFALIAVKFIAPDQLPAFMILLAGSLGIMGIITPYGTGPSPIWYGAGYISQARWWALGALFAVIYLAVLLVGVFLFV